MTAGATQTLWWCADNLATPVSRAVVHGVCACGVLSTCCVVGQAVRNSFFAIGRAKPIFLDDVNCDGSESSLFNCSHSGLRIENCDDSEHAGVNCCKLLY